MLRVRTVNDVDDFEDCTDMVQGLWVAGASRPEWCFVLEDGPSRIGRIGFRVTPTVSDPSWLGSLPPQELFVYGLDLPWREHFVEPGRQLITEAAAAMSGEVPDLLEARINNDIHTDVEERCRLMAACGMELFQEKHGFTWSDSGRPIHSPDRLSFRSVADIGIDAYRSVMAPCGDGTLDRNDRYYWEGCGQDNWARQMSVYLTDEDAPMWLVGYDEADPVGYVAVASEEEWGATIAHIGVLPDKRGNGYIHDLLTAGTAAAQRNDIGSMLSDVDVVNQPMMGAMQRAGHIEDPERWHLWVYRTNLDNLIR